MKDDGYVVWVVMGMLCLIGVVCAVVMKGCVL